MSTIAANGNSSRLANILLVEDDDGDVLLTRKALAKGKVFHSIDVVKDGVEAMAYLRKEGDYARVPRPDWILLDLNMPRKNGREVLEEIQQDRELRSIPIVVLTTSEHDQDVLKSYGLQAACYLTKPVDLEQFARALRSANDLWLGAAELPPR